MIACTPALAAAVAGAEARAVGGVMLAACDLGFMRLTTSTGRRVLVYVEPSIRHRSCVYEDSSGWMRWRGRTVRLVPA